MGKNDPSSSLSPSQRFEALAKALFAVPKKATEAKTADKRKRGKQNKSSRRSA
jgi:hypothetical protein